MRTIYSYILLIVVLSLSTTVHAQEDNRPTSYVGVELGGGFSHLFMGSPWSQTNQFSTPLFGGGATAGLFYELKYKHFLFHTGFGLDYTFNQNKLYIEDISAAIQEYPTMQYQYTFSNFIEQTTYGVGYVPVMLGASFERWYFLAGAKLGLLSFASKTQAKSDITLWATDEDIIDPLEGLYTHAMGTYPLKGQTSNIDFTPFNAMLSAEVGLNLDKRAWMSAKEKIKYDRAQRYRNARKKKTLKELTHFRVSLFAEYGLSNIRPAYQPNIAPYQTQSTGGIASLKGLTDVELHTSLGYEPYKESRFNNWLVGLKLAVQFEIPKKAPKKGALATPYVYVYVQDELTEKPISKARVQIHSTTSKSKTDKLTDEKRGRVGRGFLPGQYWAYVSHYNYLPHDTIYFEHHDDYDTLYVALYPKHTYRWSVQDAYSGRPVLAQVEMSKIDTEELVNASVDSTCHVITTVDNRLSYIIHVNASGYEAYCDTLHPAEYHNPEIPYAIRLTPLEVKNFVLQNMYFATAKTNILPSSVPALDMLYELLDENPDLQICIVGHTDNVGTEASNQILSEGRAKSVRSEMIKRGIDGMRIKIKGKGEMDPIVPNDTDQHRQMNRRVEIEILSGAENINIKRLMQ